MQKIAAIVLIVLACGCEVEGPLEACGPDNGFACVVRVDGAGAKYGQGVVIDAHHVLTVAHVVRDARSVTVSERGTDRRVGRSATVLPHPSSDLALVRFSLPLELPVADITIEGAAPGPVTGVLRELVQGKLEGPDWTNEGRVIVSWGEPSKGGDSGGGVFRAGELLALHSGSRVTRGGICADGCAYAVDLVSHLDWIDENTL